MPEEPNAAPADSTESETGIDAAARMRLDENFDQLRAILSGSGVTLEKALQVLRELRERDNAN